MIFCSLYSGSSGNSIFIGDKESKILIDAGMPGKKIDEAMKSIGQDPSKLDGIFITHEHSDHIKGVGIISRKYDVPIYANDKTWAAMESSIGKVKEHNIKVILYYEKENFISPKKLSNGYRDYSNEDIKILQEISLYRKLDISVKDIMTILKSKDKREILNRIVIEKEQKEIRLKIDKIHLERLIEGDMSINEIFRLNDEIIQEEKKSGEFIKRELKRAFPKGFGEYMAYHFSPYLNEPLDTMEKIKAWHNIVEFLDNIPQFKIPKFIQIGLASSFNYLLVFPFVSFSSLISSVFSDKDLIN